MFRVLTCLATEHDWRLVVVAAFICLLASLATINLFHRAQATAGRTRLAWLATAAVAAGCGIWATHFIAMLSYDPGIGIAYNIGLTLLSFVAAALVTGTGLSIGIYAPTSWGTLLGGAIVGIGVACMHYLGMSAVELPGRIAWSLDLVAASIVLGMVFGMAALTIAGRHRSRQWTFVAALLLVLAIVSHHFTAMGAVTVVPDPTRIVDAYSLSPASLAIAIAGIATAILATSLAGAFLDNRLRQQNSRLEAALNNMSEGLCMFDDGARLVLCNGRYIEMYRLDPALAKPGVHLRDLLEQRKSTRTYKGNPDQYIAETRRRLEGNNILQDVRELPDGRFISISSRSMPGGGWVATHQDITERRRQDQERDSLAVQAERRSSIDSAIAVFRERVEAMLRTVGDHAGAMRATASTLFSASHKTSQRAERAVHTSNEASTNVEIAASAANELSASIAEISRQLGQTSTLVGIAVNEAGATNDQIGSLANAAQKIGDVVKLIQDVAGQTNLLALNATIEAARAGDAGRGFAVVASEVKSLAVQTAKATEEIASQIAGVQASTGTAVEAIRRIADRMQEINKHTAAVAASVQQQNAATGEISDNVTSAAQGTKEIVAVLGEVAGAAIETRGSAETVLSASEAVELAASNLRQEVEGFLQKVAV